MSEKDYSEDSGNFYLNEQNKKLKKRLEDDYGMHSMGMEENAPPEVMNNFLNYVEQFEKAWEDVETKRVKEIMNFPDFKKAEEIEPSMLSEEIEKVLDVYENFNFRISVIEKKDVSELEFYKFLTEELMEHETDFIDVPGMNTNFIYEEFHPNDKLDAKDSVEHFLRALENRNEDGITTWLSKDPVFLNGMQLNRKEFTDQIFRNIPQTVSESDILFNQIDIEKNNVQVDFILTHKEESGSNETKKSTLHVSLEIEKSEYGMYNIRSVCIS